MLWDIIRDFYVQYIFGGITSNNAGYGGLIGDFGVMIDGAYEETETLTTNQFPICFITDGGIVRSLSMGDWLSTTATIITLIIICVLLGFFVRWLFRLTAGLIRGC